MDSVGDVAGVDEAGVGVAGGYPSEGLADVFRVDKLGAQFFQESEFLKALEGVGPGWRSGGFADGDGVNARAGEFGERSQIGEISPGDQNERIRQKWDDGGAGDELSLNELIHGFSGGREEKIGGSAIFDLASESVGSAKVEIDRDFGMLFLEREGDFLQWGLQAGGGGDQKTGENEILRHGRVENLSS